MQIRHFIHALLISLLPTLLFAQSMPSNAYIRDLYLRYTMQEPRPDQVDFWVQKMRRGTSAFEANVNILGSNTVFNRYGRDPVQYVTMAFNAVVNRPPQPQELAYWVGKLQRSNNDTIEFATDFLRSNGGGTPPAIGGLPPSVSPPTDLPSRLYSVTLLLNQAVQQELTGGNNWLIQSQAQNLTRTVHQYQDLLQNPNRNPQKFVEVCQSIDSAIYSLRIKISQDGYVSPHTRLYLDQADQLIDTIKLSVPAIPMPPVIVPPVNNPGIDPNISRYAQLAQDLSRNAKQAAYVFRNGLGPTWNASIIINSADGFASAADNLVSRLKYDPTRVNIRREVEALLRQLNDITQKVQMVKDVRLRQFWQDAINSYNRFADAVGVQQAGGMENPPVAIPQPVRFPPELFASIDRGIAACNRITSGYTPYAYYHPSISTLINEVQSLQTQLSLVRQECAGNPPGSLLASRAEKLRTLNERANNAWRDVLRSVNIPNAPTLTVMNASVQEVSRMLLRNY